MSGSTERAADWSAAYAVVAPERDEVEARWLADPPPTAAAFAEAAEIEARWHAALLAELGSGTLARAGCVRPGDGMTTRPGRARGTTAFTHGAPPSLVGRTPT